MFESTLKTFELPGAARATLGPGASDELVTRSPA